MSPNTLALVTGANRGLGKETARQLASRGALVLLGSRSLDCGLATARDLVAGGAEVRPIQLDVTDVASVQAAAAQVEGEYGRLDVLVNNAGLFTGAISCATTATEMRDTFDVNVFGVVTVISTLLPMVSRSTTPRIVNVSSTTASLALTSGGHSIPGDVTRRLAYASSKAALNMLTVQYAAAFARDPGFAHIKINSATPGYTATDMNEHRGTRTVQEGARIIVELATLPDDGPTGGFFDDQGPVPW